MDVRIFIETTFDDGEPKRRNIGRLRRAPDDFSCESLGLLLDDAKALLRRLQEAIVQVQVGEAMEARRNCDGCGKQRAVHDDRGRIFDTLFGRIRVKWPRRRGSCRPHYSPFSWMVCTYDVGLNTRSATWMSWSARLKVPICAGGLPSCSKQPVLLQSSSNMT